ncbi:Exocyst complex component 7 [Borealophlyctis nickersoniae]|nr:Exocyst complex component 7 [Borealophlyctis nickersoniae]
MLYMEISQFNEAQSDRRRELERKLDEDIEELERLKDSLARTNVLSEKMVRESRENKRWWTAVGRVVIHLRYAVGDGMLSSFDQRLGRLETSILPIHRSTQKLTKLYENIDKSLGQLQTVINYFDLATQEEPLVTRGPDESDLDPYLKSVQRMKDALAYLKETNYKASARGITHLKDILSRAIKQLDALFRKWLTEASTPIDPGLIDRGDLPTIPSKTLQDLSRLATELSSSVADLGPITTYIQTYEQVRSAYLVKSLHPLTVAAREQDQKGVGSKAVYVKGSSAFVPYSRCLLRLLKAERDVNHKLIPKSSASTSFSNTIAPAVDTFIEIGEAMLTRVKRGLQKKEFGDVYLLIDVVEGMGGSVKEYDGLIAYAGAKGNDINELTSSFKAATVSFFKDFYEDIKNDTVKQSALSADGTVHELTSTTLNTLKRLVHYHTAIDQILSDGSNATGATSFTMLTHDILTALTTNLETKARLYTSKMQKPTLSALFLLNNWHYVWKMFVKGEGSGATGGRTKLAEVVGEAEVKRFEAEVKRLREVYQESWKTCLEILSVTTESSAFPEGTKNLSKAQRELVKDKFKGFNTEFDEIHKAQKNYAVPDPDLRAQLLRDIKGTIVPLYAKFYGRWAHVDFTKNPQKYIKYDPETVEGLVDKFFNVGS